ncbi:MAG: MaoC family dehydratase N-terminal domain-containing protein, partial [Sneathiella sp.]
EWLDLFPADESLLPNLPPSMISAITMRAFLATVQPRPKGNIHGTQEFSVHKLPKLGDEITTNISCKDKETRKNNNWVYFETHSHDQDGVLLFTGSMGIIWGG